MQGDPLRTLLFNARLQHILKPLPEKWNRDIHGVTLVENDSDATLSIFRFADDNLLISGSLKHTTTMLDDITTATTAHGLPRHSTKRKLISNTTSKSRSMRVGNIHEPRTGVDVSKIPTERQTQAFRRHGDTITLRFR